MDVEAGVETYWQTTTGPGFEGFWWGVLNVMVLLSSRNVNR